MKQRWDNDERGRGIASANVFAPALERLLEAARQPHWVAEEPDRHLLPHVRRLCEEQGWTVSAEIQEAVLLLGVVLPAGTDPQELRAAGHAVVGPSRRNAHTSSSDGPTVRSSSTSSQACPAARSSSPRTATRFACD
jgi:hypothetical protein